MNRENRRKLGMKNRNFSKRPVSLQQQVTIANLENVLRKIQQEERESGKKE